MQNAEDGDTCLHQELPVTIEKAARLRRSADGDLKGAAWGETRGDTLTEIKVGSLLPTQKSREQG